MNRRGFSVTPGTTIVAVILGMIFSAWMGVSSAAADPPDPPAPPAPSVPSDPAADDVDLDRIPGARAAAAPVPAADPAPLVPGQEIKHQFDVVLAHIFASEDQFPSGTPVEQVPRPAIEYLLSDTAKWWSDNTGLVFDFTTGLRYKTINSTCAGIHKDAMAAMGAADATYYTGSHRNLLMLGANASCGDFAGQAYTSSGYGDVTAGGVVMIQVFDWDGSPGDHDSLTQTNAHELGHTFGMDHAFSNDCSQVVRPGDDQIGPLWDGHVLTGCKPMEYWDNSSVMGFSSAQTRTLNSLQRSFLGVGWDVTTIDQPVNKQVVTLPRYDTTSAAEAPGVVISSPDGSFLGGLEYRNADTRVVYSVPGVYLTLGRQYNGRQLATYLQNPAGLAPVATGSLPRVPLVPGATYVSQDGSVRLRTLSVTATTAQVEVTVAAQPGVPGEVSVAQHSGVLTAVALGATDSVGVTYQWLRNGQPISGATGANYTPDAGDANAVLRVEATFTAPGHAATTRSSRGIITDDRRLFADGTEVRLVMPDQDGNPVDCAGLSVLLDVSTPGGQAVAQKPAVLQGTSIVGTCIAGTVPLPGSLRLSVSVPGSPYAENLWQTAYLESPATGSARLTGAARAQLVVGVTPPRLTLDGPPMNEYREGGSPLLRTRNGNDPLAVTVAVTDDKGAPAPGVKVGLTSPLPGLVLSPADPVTDEFGFAHATADWDRGVPPPAGCPATAIEAAVAGGAAVAGSPAEIWVCSGGAEEVVAWYEGATSVTADGTDAARLHVRLWDENGDPITGAEARLSGKPVLSNDFILVGEAQVSDPVWDPADNTYVMSVTSTKPQVVSVAVRFDGGETLMVPVEFKAGDAAKLNAAGTTFLASDGSCDGADPWVGRLIARPSDAGGNAVTLDDGVIFSLPPGSPLRFISDPVVPVPGRYPGQDGYAVGVTSPVPGRFEAFVRTPDGSMTETFPVWIFDAQIDPAASAITLSDGPVMPDGKDSYTLTADLVSLCHVPVRTLPTDSLQIGAGAFWVRVAATDPATGQPATAVTVGALTEDPAKPGTHTARVTATQAGTYALSFDSMTWTLVDKQWDWHPAPVNPEPLLAEFGTRDSNVVDLSLSADHFAVTPGSCGGTATVLPDKVTATVTVTGGDGKPVGGLPVDWAVDVPLSLGTGGAVTGPDGKAVVDISVDVDKLGLAGAPPVVRVVVDGSSTRTATLNVFQLMPGPMNPVKCWSVSFAPTGGGTTVDADGVSSWTVTVLAADNAGKPLPGHTVRFAANGSAVLSSESEVTGQDGLARITVKDSVAETVELLVDSDVPLEPPLAPGGPSLWPVPGTPVSLEFVPVPVVVVGAPVLGEANRTVISGTVVVGAGESEPVSVQVTYPSTRGPLTIEAAVRDHRWSVATPDDAVSGTLTLVARDAKNNASARVTGALVIPELKAQVGSLSLHRGETQQVTGFGFAAGEKVRLVVHSQDLDLGVATADDNGKVVFGFKIPAGFDVGDHAATLTGEKSGSVSAGFKVLADKEQPVNPDGGDGKPQPQTGGMVAPAPAGTPLGLLPYGELVLLVLALAGAAATGERGRVARQRHPKH